MGAGTAPRSERSARRDTLPPRGAPRRPERRRAPAAEGPFAPGETFDAPGSEEPPPHRGPSLPGGVPQPLRMRHPDPTATQAERERRSGREDQTEQEAERRVADVERTAIDVRDVFRTVARPAKLRLVAVGRAADHERALAAKLRLIA